MSKAAKPGATAGHGGSQSNVNLYDPIAVARSDPFFKRNHMGKVTCTLCNVYCNDENAFIKHQAGKTHTLQLENMDRQRRKRQHIEEEVRIDAAKAAAAAKEKATKELLTSSSTTAAAPTLTTVTTSSGKTVQILSGRFGVPLYTFRVEHEDGKPAGGGGEEGSDAQKAKEGEGEGEEKVKTEAEAEQEPDKRRKKAKKDTEGPSSHARAGSKAYQTKVWLDFNFSKAEEGTRPLHRWLSAREQHVETPADDYYVYLLVACEGYTTVALKFPAKLNRSQEGDAKDENGESVYRCWWDPLRKEYAMYFILSR